MSKLLIILFFIFVAGFFGYLLVETKMLADEIDAVLNQKEVYFKCNECPKCITFEDDLYRVSSEKSQLQNEMSELELKYDMLMKHFADSYNR